MAWSDQLVTTTMLQDKLGISFPPSLGTNRLLTFKTVYDLNLSYDLVSDSSNQTNQIIKISDLDSSNPHNDERLNIIEFERGYNASQGKEILRVIGITYNNSHTTLDTYSDIQITATFQYNSETHTFFIRNTNLSVGSEIYVDSTSYVGNNTSYLSADIYISSQHTTDINAKNWSTALIWDSPIINQNNTEFTINTNSWAYVFNVDVTLSKVGLIIDK